MGGGEGFRRRKRALKNRSFCTYIYKVLKQVHPEVGISKNAMAISNDFVQDIFMRILAEAVNLLEFTKKSTMTSREVQTAARLVLPGELAKHAISEGTKAVVKFHAAQDESGKPASRSSRAGLVFPVGRVLTMMREKSHLRIGSGAPIYLSAVLEYLCAEVLELAGNASRDNKRIRIIPRHVQLAIRSDDELDRLCKNATICGGGILPNVHPVLLFSKSPKVGGSFNHGNDNDNDNDNDDEDGNFNEQKKAGPNFSF